jgi:2-oxoglutarate ferredoxin oxidoreductase subunit alpha
LEHRVGGLEKDKISGNVSYVPENHEYMTHIRAEKVKRVQNYIPDQGTEFADSGDLLVVGWGGTYGGLHSAVKHLHDEGYTNIGFAHFHYLNPLPKNTEALFKRFKKIVVCELNSGQLVKILRANFQGHEFLQYNKIQGLPFANNELMQKFKQIVS